MGAGILAVHRRKIIGLLLLSVVSPAIHLSLCVLPFWPVWRSAAAKIAARWVAGAAERSFSLRWRFACHKTTWAQRAFCLSDQVAWRDALCSK